MNKMKVPYNYLAQQFDVDGALVNGILGDIKELVRTGEFTLGPQVREFEEKFAALCGVSHAIGINSGTDALILILKALGIGPGDEVITVPNSFIATANAILFVGAKPVFVDVDDEYLMDINLVKAAITPKTKAIIPVHIYGQAANMEEINKIAKAHKLKVIEDAAHAFGCTYKGRKIGSFGDLACFSFDGIKNITSGEGGAVVTSDPEVIQAVQDARLLGVQRDTEKRYQGARSWEFEPKTRSTRVPVHLTSPLLRSRPSNRSDASVRTEWANCCGSVVCAAREAGRAAVRARARPSVRMVMTRF